MALKIWMKVARRGLTGSLFFLLLLRGSVALTQTQAPLPVPPPVPPDQMLTPDQLNDLVAPIALYPDPLLSQVLVAATYPLEVVQAYQWLQRNPGLAGPALTQAAQEQNWDASIQALVVFPDVVKRLNDDITWTTNLGNAFLSQQQDVMDAVQRMRQTAEQAGRLQPTPQENVVTTTENGQPYVEILPAQPDVIYVPVYDPAWIWGPPVWYPYPRWYWPPRPAPGLYFTFGGPINVGLFFGVGWHGWGGWGWHPGWGTHTIVVNNTFIHEHNFNTTHVERVHGSGAWVHDPVHRAGVPYANSKLRQQYGDTVRRNVAPRAIPAPARTPGGQPTERFGNRDIPRNLPPAQNRGVFSGIQNGSAARTHEEHGFSSLGPARSMPAPRPAAPFARPAPAPRSAPAPRGRGR